MTTYFLSYARADATIALGFADELIAAGVALWVDQYDIRPSQHWDRAVETAVRSCQGLVVILSPRSAASANVADEVSVAIEAGKDVIPVMIETCTLPLRMTRMQFIDATTDRNVALKRCLAAINSAGRAAHPAEIQPTDPPQLTVHLAPEILRKAELRLTGIMGPISAVLVRNAGTSATTEVELYRTLAASIPDEAQRDVFLGWLTDGASGGAPKKAEGPGLSAQELDAVTTALARQIGPIARQLVRRETQSAATKQDLCRTLGARIEADKDRAAFFRDVGLN